ELSRHVFFSFLAKKFSLFIVCIITSDNAQMLCWPLPSYEALRVVLLMHLYYWKHPKFHSPDVLPLFSHHEDVSNLQCNGVPTLDDVLDALPLALDSWIPQHDVHGLQVLA